MRLLLALSFCCLSLPAFAKDCPNFIVFVADDMGWEDCGAYGHPHIRTPNMDALAAAGMRFDRAYLTCSSCSPSRCSILTGRYPHSTGAGELHLPLPAEQTLFTQSLGEAGYWTAAVGKWHLGDAVADQVAYRESANPKQMGAAWVAALQQRPKEKPFFLWAAHSDPHRGYQPGAVDPPHTRSDVVVPPYLPDTPEVRDDLALYYDEVSRFDEHIGMVLAELDRQQIAEKTFVLVISDNGRPFPYCKTMVQVPGVRTPFIARWPGKVPAGTVSKSVVSTVDLAPTILEFAGVQLSESYQGVSLAKVLADPQALVRTYAFAEHNWHDYQAFERAVQSGRFCYVRNWLPMVPGTPPADAVRSPTYVKMKQLFAKGALEPALIDASFSTPRPAEFLYDVESDPHCLKNLAPINAYASTLLTMRSALSDWQMETGDEFPGVEQVTPDGFDRNTGERMISAAHPALQD